MARHEGPSCEVSLQAIPDTVMRTMPTPENRNHEVCVGGLSCAGRVSQETHKNNEHNLLKNF